MKLKTLTQMQIKTNPDRNNRYISEKKAAKIHVITKSKLKKIKKSGTPKEIKEAKKIYAENVKWLKYITQDVKRELYVYAVIAESRKMSYNQFQLHMARFPIYDFINGYEEALLKKHDYLMSRKNYVKKLSVIMDADYFIDFYKSTPFHKKKIKKVKKYKADFIIASGGFCPVYAAVELYLNTLVKTYFNTEMDRMRKERELKLDSSYNILNITLKTLNKPI